MGDETRNGPDGAGARDARDARYASTGNPADRNEHRHGDVVHLHDHAGPHEHGDDYEYDEAHDPDARAPGGR